ncbi:MAG: ABC transporter permease, partial [Inhella sp.]
ALMETLADYGVGSYFGLNTLTTGIYKAWLVNGDRWAAAQLASVLLVAVMLLMLMERRAQARLRFAPGKGGGAATGRHRLRGIAQLFAQLACLLPLLLGFVIPLLVLLRLVVDEARFGEIGLPWARFGQWSVVSLGLAAAGAALTVGLALLLSALRRLRPRAWLPRAVAQLAGLGYAVPGAVIAIGLLLPLAWLQPWLPSLVPLVTGSVAGLLWAYAVRFSGVALQSVEAGYARIAPSLDESAQLLGQRGPGLWWRVHRPLLTRSALAAALLVFVDIMKELPATLVLRPFDSDTLAVVAYQLARDERLAEAALPAIAIVLVGLLPVGLLWRAMKLR